MTEAGREESAFWHAIAESPDDESVRLIFADWLEDRGDPRAAWFRDPLLSRWMRPGAADPVPALLAELDRDDQELDQVVITALGRVGAAAAPALLQRCRDGSDDQAYWAGQALAEMDGAVLQPHLPELIRLLPKAGRFLDGALGKIGLEAAPAVPALLEAEQRGHISTAALALVLEAIGPGAAAGVPRLVAIACRNGEEASLVAARALAAIGPETIEPFLAELNRVDPDLLFLVATGLSEYGCAVVPRLVDVLREPDSQRRDAAVLALARLAPELALPHLIGGLRAKAPPIRGLYVRAVREIGAAAAAAAPVLQELLGDAEPWFVDQVAQALAAVTGRAGLFQALSDEQANVRAAAVSHLGATLNRGEADAVAPLRPALRDPDERVRAGAATALGRLKDAARGAISELITAMRDPAAAVRLSATVTVDGMQYETPEMLAALLEALDDPEPAVRQAAVHGLEQWGQLFPSHAAAVFRRVQDPDPLIRRGAVRLLGKAREATPEMIAFLHQTLSTSDDPELRRAAAAGLARFPGASDEVLADVLAFLDAHGEREVAEALCQQGPAAVSALGERLIQRPDLRPLIVPPLDALVDKQLALPALAGLIACLGDPAGDIRVRAASVIGGLGPQAAEAVPHLRPCSRTEARE